MSKLSVNLDKASKEDLIAIVKHLDEILRSKHEVSVVDIFNDEIDSAGFKWDPRVHHESKTKSLNGRWKLKPDATREELNTALGLQRDMVVQTFNTDYLQEAEKKFIQLETLIRNHLKLGYITQEDMGKLKKDYCLPKFSNAKTNLTLIEELIKKITELATCE
jgi:hypothetical protein